MVVLFECGIQVCPIDGYHLSRWNLHGDRLQMDEGGDASPASLEKPPDGLLVLIDTVIASRLRGIEAGQQECGQKTNDRLRGARWSL